MQLTRSLTPANTAVLRVGSTVANDPAAMDELAVYLELLRWDGVQVNVGHGGDVKLANLARATGACSVVIREASHLLDDDWACERLATELHADRLEFATDVPAVFTKNGPADNLTIDEANRLIALGTVQGGMVPKLYSAMMALRDGVPTVQIGDARSLRRGNATTIVSNRPTDVDLQSPHPATAKPLPHATAA